MRSVCNILMATALLAGAQRAAAADPAEVLREARLTAIDGTEVRLGEPSARAVVVNFWATWCRPCQRELTALDAWRSDLGARGVEFVAVSVDTDRKKVDRFLDRHGIGLTVVHDGPDGLARRLDLPYLPCTYVLDESGEVVWVGNAADASALDQLHEKLLTMADASSPEVAR